MHGYTNIVVLIRIRMFLCFIQSSLLLVWMFAKPSRKQSNNSQVKDITQEEKCVSEEPKLPSRKESNCRYQCRVAVQEIN